MLSPGDRIAGKYLIERPLGEGGMGAVYVALNEKLHKRVALKLLRREIASAPGAAERFTREAIAASRARHPGIVEIYDADVHEGIPWIAMELLEGESLGDRVMRAPLSIDEAIAITVEALGALAHVHRAGIVHRDLKPDNLFLETLPDGGRRVKILDFGIAASIGPGLARVTESGMAIGTPMYFAPEQAAGQTDLDARVDVYAMGVILFELIAGRLPYPAESLGQMVRLMYTQGPPSLVSVVSGIDPALASLVQTALAVDREARVQSADAFKRGLELVAAAGTHSHAAPRDVHTPRPGPPTPVAEPTRPRSITSAVLIAIALGVTVGAIGGAAYFLDRTAASTAVSHAPAPEPTVPIVVPEPIAIDPPLAVAPPLPIATPVEAVVPVEPPIGQSTSRTLRGRIAVGSTPSGGGRGPTPPAPTVAPPAANPEPVAAPTETGLVPLSNATLTRVMEANEPRLDDCYFRAFPDRPRPRVPIELEFTIDRDGTVEQATATSGHAYLDACTRRVMSTARFPAHPQRTHARLAMTYVDEEP